MTNVTVLTLTAQDRTKAAFESVRRSLSGLESSAARTRSIFATLGAAVSAGALVGFVRSSIDAADAMQQLSERTNTAVEGLSVLQYAAKLNDVSNESLAVGLKQLGKTVAEGSDAFRQLGVETRGVGLDKVMADVAQALLRIEDPTRRNAAALEIFKKQAFELQPLLNALSQQGLKPFADEAQRAGLIISGETARAAAQFNDDMDRLKSSVSGIGLTLARDLVGPLTQVSAAFVDATQKGGLFAGAVRGYGEAWKVAMFGADPSQIQKQTEFVADLRKEVAALQDRLKASDQARGIARLGGDPAKMRRDLATVQLTLRQAEQSLERMRNPPAAAPASKAAPLTFNPKAAAESAAADAARARAFAEARRQETANAREIERIVTDARQSLISSEFRLAEDAREKERQAAVTAAAEVQQAIASMLGDTQIGRVKRLEKALESLAEAGRRAPQEQQEQFAQAFEKLNVELQKARGLSTEGFRRIEGDGTETFDRLKVAVEGWGRRTSDVFAEVVTGGKANFADLVQSMIRESISLAAYQQLFGPLFGAIGAGVGGLFGVGAAKVPVGIKGLPGRAVGGPVTAGMPYLVGERGPELFVPGNSGRIKPNDQLGGGSPVINVFVDSRSDRAAVMMDVKYVVRGELAKDRDERSRGRYG